MPNNNNAAVLKAGGLILAGAVAGLSGGAYSGDQAGASAVHRELGSHDARIEQLQTDVQEVRQDVKTIQRDVNSVGNQLNRIETLLEELDGENR